jgi:hypothetical protein
MFSTVGEYQVEWEYSPNVAKYQKVTGFVTVKVYNYKITFPSLVCGTLGFLMAS